MRSHRLSAVPAWSEAGITFIEILVTCCIMVSIAAIATPIYLNQRASSEKTAIAANANTTGKAISEAIVGAQWGYEPSVSIAGNILTIDTGFGGGPDIDVRVPGEIQFIDGAIDPDRNAWCVVIKEGRFYSKVSQHEYTEITDTASDCTTFS